VLILVVFDNTFTVSPDWEPEDNCRFALPLDIARFSDQHHQQIRYGYQAAKQLKLAIIA